MTWPTINPGDLRHCVSVQSPSSIADAAGQPLNTWTTVLSTKAQIRSLTERELYQAGQFTSQVTHVITMRWSPVNINATMQVVHGNQAYKIQAVKNVLQMNLVVNLTCLALNEGTNP